MDLSIRSLYDQIPFGIFVWRLMSNFFYCCFMNVVFIETDTSTRKETLTLKFVSTKRRKKYRRIELHSKFQK